MKKALIILSGGLDSTTLLYWARSQRYEIKLALSFDYESTHSQKELLCADWHCKFLNIPHKIVKLDFMKDFNSSSLINRNIKVPEGHYAEETMKTTVVSNRNMIMLAIAVGYAENLDISEVLLGSHLGDRAQYKDCTEEFTQSISLTSMLATIHKVKVTSPFNSLMKWDIVGVGLDLGVSYEKTWSCYVGGDRPCLKCGTCVERTEAFQRNGTRDPLLTNEEWGRGAVYMNEVLKEFNKKKI